MNNINARQLGLFLLAGLGVLFSFFAGNYVADENYIPLLAVAGFMVVSLVFFSVGTSVYLLIPACWGLQGQISILPLPFDVRELAIILASVFFVSGLIFKTDKGKLTIEKIDVILLINIGYLVTVFFRNPVGINALGGDRVGGKPYVDVVLGMMAYIMLSRYSIRKQDALKLPLIWICTAGFSSLAGTISQVLPGLGTVLGKFYSPFTPFDMSEAGGDVTMGETRVSTVDLGSALVLYVCSKYNPTTILKNNRIGAFFSYLLGWVLIFLSGFRNAIIGAFLTTLAATVLRDRFLGFVKVAFLTLTILIGGVLISYTNITIPLTFQRALSFLPGNWDQEAIQDAKGSTEWRFRIWTIALTSEKYIKSKMLGDGFGFLRADLETMADAMHGGAGFGGEDSAIEAELINGDFHSGPVSSIRCVGYVGLLLFFPLLIAKAIYALDFIKNARGTHFQFLSLFVGIPNIFSPFFFVFIFGDYRGDLIGTLYTVGLLKMLNKALKKELLLKNG